MCLRDDAFQTGCADIVIGREDGTLEVWDIDPQGQPQLMVSTQLPESITAVDGGYITNAGSPDIIVHTFTGKVSCCPCCYNQIEALYRSRRPRPYVDL